MDRIGRRLLSYPVNPANPVILSIKRCVVVSAFHVKRLVSNLKARKLAGGWSHVDGGVADVVSKFRGHGCQETGDYALRAFDDEVYATVRQVAYKADDRKVLR